MDRKASFPPFAHPHTRLLLLGSLPGEASLRASRYYAHPQNQFWRLLSGVIGRDIATMAYEERLVALEAAGIGVWDVVADAVRAGSLDTAIRDHRPNDLRALIATLPALRAIGFNGKTASRIGHKLVGDDTGLALIDLPSSSPAYTIGFDEKMTAWRALKKWIATA